MKKILCLLILVITAVCVLSSCSNTGVNPIDAAKTLDEKDYYVSMVVDEDDIDYVADEVEIKAKGIRCVLSAQPDDFDDKRSGVVFYCSDTDIAKDMEEDLNNYMEKDEFADGIIRCTVERSGTVVFFGCEDVWEDMQ